MEVKTNRSLISALYKIDGDARAGGAVGLNENVAGVLIGTDVALVKILSLSQVPNCDLSILRSCRWEAIQFVKIAAENSCSVDAFLNLASCT